MTAEFAMRVLMWALGLAITFINGWVMFALRSLRAEDKALLERIENERDTLHKRVGELRDHVEGDFARQRDLDRLESRIADDIREIKDILKAKYTSN